MGHRNDRYSICVLMRICGFPAPVSESASPANFRSRRDLDPRRGPKGLMPLLQPIPAAPQILTDPPPAAPKKASEMEQAVVQAFGKRGMHGVL